MPKGDRFLFAAIGLVAGIAFAFLFLVWSVPEFRDPSRYRVGQPNPAEIEQSQNDDVGRLVAAIREFEPWDDTYAQWLMAAFTVAATGVSLVAVILLRNTLHESKRSTERQLRAYLSVVPAGIATLKKRERIIGQVRVRNVGQAIASNVRLAVSMGVSKNRDLAIFPIKPERVRLSGSIVPTAEIGKGSYETIPASFVTASDRVRKYAYVWGVVYYNDGFGNERRTSFCHRYNCESADIVGNVLFQGDTISIASEIARYHETGNDAD